VRHRVALSAGLMGKVEHRAAAAGRPVDLEYGRLFALGLLAKLAEEVSPLFPELGSPARRKNDDPGSCPPRVARIAKPSSPNLPAPTVAPARPPLGAGAHGT
jgi:hypothetical protein